MTHITQDHRLYYSSFVFSTMTRMWQMGESVAFQTKFGQEQLTPIRGNTGPF